MKIVLTFVGVYLPSTSSVPSVKTSLVKFEICPVIWDKPDPNHEDMFLCSEDMQSS